MDPASHRESRTAFAYPTPPGVGGLGHHAAQVLDALAGMDDLDLFGPLAGASPSRGRSHSAPPDPLVPHWRRQYTSWRYRTGRFQLEVDRRFGRWLASRLSARPYRRGYFFTQIALEGLAVARDSGTATILDSPTGHIRDHREQLRREAKRCTGWWYTGHPSEAMVRRVEDEYRLADRIRVSSQWARRSLMLGGVDEHKIFVVPQSVDVGRFVPAKPPEPAGPLRLVFVGSISLGKGFQYLLRTMSRLGADRFSLEMVGATGDPWCRRLLRQLSQGLTVSQTPGDPLPAYQRGELFVLPSLHDGFGLVVAEAMACGLAVITTDACGASEWVQDGESGWIVPRGDEDALAVALDHALSRRTDLREMGRAARRAVEGLNHETITQRLRERLEQEW